jgi:hypothetical protein
MTNIIYTAITNGKDTLKENQNKENAKLVAFTEFKSQNWEVRKPINLFIDPNRNSKIYKVLTHQFLDCDYSLWIDGSITLLAPIQNLIDYYLKDNDIAMFKHYKRDCIYDEAKICKKMNLDNPEIINKQMTRYKNEGYPVKNGLNEGTIILRRHTKKITEFNNLWWSEICSGSKRDQLSLNYCFWKLKIKPAIFPLTVYKSSLFNFQAHRDASKLKLLKPF